jgi:hypothetical protein
MGLVWWRWDERGCAGSLAKGSIAGVCGCLGGAQDSIVLVAWIGKKLCGVEIGYKRVGSCVWQTSFLRRL